MHTIIGCGEVGRRIVRHLLRRGSEGQASAPEAISAWVRSDKSAAALSTTGIHIDRFDLDQTSPIEGFPDREEARGRIDGSRLVYSVAPASTGTHDDRSATYIAWLEQYAIRPSKILLLSTTGVYGDAQGEWVDELTPINPQTDRAKRRVAQESLWREFAERQGIPLIIFRVSGIYARARLPRERLQRGTPMVRPAESGLSNRIHADDLAALSVRALAVVGEKESKQCTTVFNVADGRPAPTAEFLRAAARALQLPPPPEVSLAEALEAASPTMRSYLLESRKISSKKLLAELEASLMYPDFRAGVWV